MSTDRFDKMKNYVMQNVAFYANNSIVISQGNDNFNEFPIIDKNILREKYDEFVSNSINVNEVMIQYTSGSTGLPLKLLKSKNEINR